MIPLPILLIHGFNGAPSNWTGPDDDFPEFLSQNGFDPALVRAFSYGYDDYKGKPVYNNLGDIRQIAHRLDDPKSPDAHDCSIEQLCRDSVAQGGPGKATIIAHSSGGLIARYYLTRQHPDEFGTCYRGNVRRVVFLGTPHNGVDVEDILDPLPTNILVYRLMVRAHYLFPREYHEQSETWRTQFREARRAARGTFALTSDESLGETPAFKQFHPGSPFLNDINRPGAMPRDVDYENIVGDIRAKVQVAAFGRTLLNSEKSFGDFLVTTDSAGSIPNAPSNSFPLVDEYSLAVDIGHRASRLVELKQTGERNIPIHRHLRSLPASRERMLKILENG